MSTSLLHFAIFVFYSSLTHGHLANLASRTVPTFGHIEYQIASFHQQVTSNISYGLNVLDFGAVGDAKTDNTDAFTKALNAAKSGGYVYVPTGQYLFKGQLTIPSGVTLIGTYLVAPYHKPPQKQAQGITLNELKDGSILVYDGDTHSPFITMKQSSFIKGLSIFYPKQVANEFPPISYNSTILISGANVAILDMELINPYIGISMAEPSARHYIARVQGGPIHIGIFIDNCHDIGRIEDVHFKGDWYINNDGTFNATTIKHTTLYYTGICYVILGIIQKFIN